MRASLFVREMRLERVPQSGGGAGQPVAGRRVARAVGERPEVLVGGARGLLGAVQPWLRPDLDLDRATEIFWAVFSHETAEALVTERGWTVEEYADWEIDSLQRLLLRPGEYAHP